MTPDANQLEAANLLRDLQRSASVIVANTGLPLAAVKAWLRSGRWPAVDRQKTFFDMAGEQPRETTQPATASKGNHGLSLFASDSAGRPDPISHPDGSDLSA